ncbi:VWA domain-containing protein [Nocardioides anomalus]|uniref:VWA domain-containing protein n=1 Tax=Nocardioides anomalus TaxID=2712223 RepID=A0A6G6WBE6_9ACTN|nr:type II secretion system F family protein [Nocardioides anomalus]QIG42536.1 VWA domain-containing protein [Nocardioides anomalus]
MALRTLTRVAAGLLAAGLGLAPTAAFAADASISHVETKPGSVQLLVSVPADADVDLDKVTVTVDGQQAAATAEPAGEDNTVRRTAVLAIDTSMSMKGSRFDAAKVAAQEFLTSVPADVFVGIVTFAGDVTTVLEPTTDRGAAQAALSGLTLSKQTRLYDGVVQAVSEAGTDGQRSLLVLSDGADTSTTPIDDATQAIKDGEVLTDVVALDQDGKALDALQQLATAGDGQVISSDPAALQAAFAAEADVLARQVLVTATLPSGFAKSEAQLKVTLATSAGSVTAEAFSSVVPGAAPLVRETAWTPPSWALYAGPVALALGLVLAVVLLAPRKQPKLSAEDRVTRYTQGQGAAAGDGGGGLLGDTDVTFAAAKETAANVLRRNEDLDARISARLQAAGSELKSSEWLLVHGAIFFLSGLLGLFLGGGNLIFGFLFIVLGAVGPWFYLGFRRSRRRKAFNASLPDTLQLMSGSLAAGLSLAQSIDTIVREGAEPIASEFRRVLVETRLGVTLEDALEGVGERFDSKDFEWVVMAIKIQRQVGGNLAELLDTVAATMREREYVRRQVAALAAEGKLSAWVLGGLPPLFMIYLLLTNYDYVIVMFQEPLGWAMLAGAATILGVGVFWMSRLVKVEV